MRRPLRVEIQSLELRRLLALTHLYTFDGNANDSVGTAHATLFNGASVNSGVLQLTNAGITSGQSNVQYARLPAGVLPDSGSATIETWFTVHRPANWGRVFDFGDNAGASGNSYLFFTAASSNADARAVLRPAGQAERVATAPTQEKGGMKMATLVLDSAADQLRLFINGVLVSTTGLAGAGIASINDVNLYLGRSLFSTDPGFSGTIDELRIYDEALSDATIAAHAATGPAEPATATFTRQMEYLDRGLVVLNTGSGNAYVGWRLLGTDPANIAFNVYRQTGAGAPVKRNASPITASTDFSDTAVDYRQPNTYFVKPVVNGVEQAASRAYTLGANPTGDQYLSIPLKIPAGGTHRDGVAYTYSNYEASAGDLDGDGRYEIITSWSGVNAADSPFQAPYLIDAYTLDGAFLWRINLGKNIAYQVDGFLVYDLDGDGKSELISRTSDGTVDGIGTVIGNPTADHVNVGVYPDGWTINAPDFLTIFSGETGAARTTIPFKPAMGAITDWGDNYGQRAHQIMGAIAYLDGHKPSLVYTRGIYHARSPYAAKTEMVAYDYDGTTLTERWFFRAALGSNNNINSNFVGQGNHQLSIADVDADGKDEIVYGSMVVDDNGRGLFSTGMEHGDALHVADHIPSRPGLEVFGIHENEGTFDPTRPPGAAMYDGRTGEVIFGVGNGADVGRGNAADIDPTQPGSENWGGPGGLRDALGNTISTTTPATNNFLIWWDGDVTRELLDRNYINKWNWTTNADQRLLTADFVATNQGTKQFPALTADLIGDWREEVVWRAADSSELRIYTTTIPSQARIYTLMHDAQYRLSVAWQNFGYNQPPHTGFHLGAGMATPPMPNISTPMRVDIAPAAPTDLTAVVATPTSIQLAWKPVAGATGYRVLRSDEAGGPFITLADSLASPAFLDESARSGGTYHYVVTAVKGIIESERSAAVSATTALPSPWIGLDIGTLYANGRSTYANGVFEVRSAAATSGNGLRMVSQTVTGDAEIVARVDAKSNRLGYAGVSFRKSTAANAAYIAVEVTPADRDRIFLRYRNTDGGSETYAVAYNAVPVWVKLVRAGNNFSGYYSTDGAAWTQIGTTRAITMPAAVPAGLVVSGSNAAPTTARFSSVAISRVAGAAPNVLRADDYFQRGPHELGFTFSEPVTVDVNDIIIQNLATSALVVPVAMRYDPAIATWTVTLPPSLPDGNYRATITGVTDLQGTAMTSPFLFNFRELAGDVTRDGTVNFDDLLVLAQNYGRTGMTWTGGNITRDGAGNVDFDDLLALAQRYGSTLITSATSSASTAKRRRNDVLE